MIKKLFRHYFRPVRNRNYSTKGSELLPFQEIKGFQSATSVSVKAYYIALNINLQKVRSSIYPKKKSRHELKSITIEIDKQSNQYISVFSYGSVVMFNIPESHHKENLQDIQDSGVITPLSNPMEHVEDYKIMINPNLAKPSVIKAEHVNIRELNNNNMAIISTVIAHSVALDYYALTVEKMLTSFMKMNRSIEESGSFKGLKMKGLYQVIATNNRIYATVLSKLGIFEGLDAAWDNGDYYDTWKGKLVF
jgi:uncharacterized Rmd1/YagE family protein